MQIRITLRHEPQLGLRISRAELKWKITRFDLLREQPMIAHFAQ